MVASVSLYFLLKDKKIKPTNKTINKIKIHQVLDEGYTYRVDWILGQDKLLAYLDGYVEMVDIYSGKREKILKLNEREVNGYQPLCMSPDGSKVILKENEDVIIFNLQTKVKEKIFTDGAALEFSWSPDGKNIAYESNNDVFIYSFESKQIKRLTFDQKYWYPHWAPVDDWIAFRDYHENGLWVIKADGSNSKKLVNNNVRHYLWHPNGEIYFFKKNEDENSLFVVNINDNTIKKYLDIDFPSVIDISPNGKQILLTKPKIREDVDDVITDFDIEDIDIIVMDFSSKQMINLTNTPTQMEVDPNWAPDGKKILIFKVKNIRDTKPIPAFIEVGE